MVLETIYSCNCITLDSRAVFQIEMSLGQRPFYHAYAPLFDILPTPAGIRKQPEPTRGAAMTLKRKGATEAQDVEAQSYFDVDKRAL